MENNHHFKKLGTSFDRMKFLTTRSLIPVIQTTNLRFCLIFSSSAGFLAFLVSFSEIMIFLIAKCDSPTYVGSNKYDYMQQRKYFPANKITSIEKSIANFKNKSLVTATMHEG